MQACARCLRMVRRWQRNLPNTRVSQSTAVSKCSVTVSVRCFRTQLRSLHSGSMLLFPLRRLPYESQTWQNHGGLFDNNRNNKERRSVLALQRRHFAVEQIDVPNLGDSISEGAVANILKNIGEAVAVDEVVMEIETDKVTIEIRSPKAGVVSEISTEVDAEVAVGDPLFKIDTEGKADPSAAPPPPKAAAAESPAPAAAPAAAAPPTPAASAAAAAASSPMSSPSSSVGGRVPMIQFKYGVREIPRSSGIGGGMDSVEVVCIGEEYGRLGFSEVDIAIINSGGAEYLDVVQLLRRKKVAKKK